MTVIRRRTVFQVIDAKNSPKLLNRAEKSFSGEKRPLNGKRQNFATRGFMLTLIHVFLPSSAEIGKAEVAKTVAFGPFWGAPGAISPKIVQDHSFHSQTTKRRLLEKNARAEKSTEKNNCLDH